MLLTISTTHRPATDLGFLLHKHPGRCQSFELSFGAAHVFYPEAREDRCTAALLLDVDPVGLVRSKGRPLTLDQYVNDRPYAASSMLSVAIARVFNTALGGRCSAKPGLAATPIPLEASLPALPARGGEAFLRALFEPLGYALDAVPIALDERFAEWGDSRYLRVTLRATTRLADLLSHLYVLVPVLDADKHYWVGADEVDKLLRHGEGWLADHPLRERIAERYLRRDRSLVRDALTRLEADEADPALDTDAERAQAAEDACEPRVGLHAQRIGAVVAALKQAGARRVVDLGCGEGKLVKALLADRTFEHVTGVDVSWRALEIARRRLRIDRLPPAQAARVDLLHGSLVYRDRRLEGFDAAAVVEVIEHLDPVRLRSFEHVLFGCARPATVVLTTPNVEYNVRLEGLPAGTLRHRDHRFEWTREELAEWCASVANRFGYTWRVAGVGPDDPEVGCPSQMAVLTRTEEQP